MAEPFFGTLKTESFFRRVWTTKKNAKIAVGARLEDRYNQRRHSSFGQTGPVTFEVQRCRQNAAPQQDALPRVH